MAGPVLYSKAYTAPTCSFTGGGWIGLVVGGGSWEIRVKGNLTQRPDGRVNSSPVSTSLPLYRIQHGCQHVIRLPG